MYNKITPDIVEALRQIVGEGDVLVDAEGIYRLALSLGGMITGEHGVGATRRRYLPLALDAVQIDVMRQIRAVFDPNGILNPGKIFP
jgi:FAD/FMN-containing dehydrogenase